MNKEELKRLEWLDKATNNSYGLKNRHEAQCKRENSQRKGRSGSRKRR